jgi:hypothetical protein
VPVPALCSQAQPAQRARRRERPRVDIGNSIRRLVFGLPGGFPYPRLRLWRGGQRGGLIDLLIDFRRRREGGDKLDVNGFSLVLDAAWCRQRDEHRQNQGKGGCVDEADANQPKRKLDLLRIDHTSEERCTRLTRDRSYLSRAPLCKPSAFHHNPGRCAGAGLVALELGPRSCRDLAKGLGGGRCRLGGDDRAPFI